MAAVATKTKTKLTIILIKEFKRVKTNKKIQDKKLCFYNIYCKELQFEKFEIHFIFSELQLTHLNFGL